MRFATATHLVAVMLALGTSACPSAGGTETSLSDPLGRTTASGTFLSFDMIQESGARTAWQALERLVPSLRLRSSASGEPVGLGHRHRSPKRGSQSTLVVIDGAPAQGLAMLKMIPADDIAHIRVQSMTEAFARYGHRGWNGAIIVETLKH